MKRILDVTSLQGLVNQLHTDATFTGIAKTDPSTCLKEFAVFAGLIPV
jgi:hypothetical protein